jgi:hypothetical protein
MIVFVGTVGEFSLAGQTLIVLLLEAALVMTFKQARSIDFAQIFVGLAAARFLRLLFTQFTHLHTQLFPFNLLITACLGPALHGRPRDIPG